MAGLSNAAGLSPYCAAGSGQRKDAPTILTARLAGGGVQAAITGSGYSYVDSRSRSRRFQIVEPNGHNLNI